MMAKQRCRAVRGSGRVQAAQKMALKYLRLTEKRLL